MGLAIVEWVVLRSLGRAPFCERPRCSVLQFRPSAAGPALLVFWTCGAKPQEGMRHNLELSDRRPGKQPRALSWPGISPRCVVPLGDAGLVALGTLEGTIYLWDSSHPESTPATLGTHPGTSMILASDAAGQSLTAANEEQTCTWDIPTRQLRWRRSDIAVTSLAMHPTAQTIVCGTRQGAVVELDLASGDLQRTLAQHKSAITGLDVSADGLLVASIGLDRRLLMTDYRRPETLWSQQHYPNAEISFSPTGDTLVSSGFVNDNWMLMTWDVATGEARAELRGHRGIILGIIFDKDNHLYSWSSDGTIRTWDLRRGEQSDSYAPGPPC